MSQHTGSHKVSLNLLGEKYLNESHWPMRRIRLLECKDNAPAKPLNEDFKGSSFRSSFLCFYFFIFLLQVKFC